MSSRAHSAVPWSVVGLALLIFAIPPASGLLLHRWIHALVTADAEHHLSVLADTTERAVETWVRTRSQLADHVAADPQVREHALHLLQTPDGQLADSAHQHALRARFTELIHQAGFQGFFVVRLDGTSVGSSRDANLGTRNPLLDVPEALVRIRSGHSVVSRPQRSDVALLRRGRLVDGAPTMFAAAPLIDYSGRVQGFLSLRIDPTLAYLPMLEEGRPGGAGETYAVDAEGRLMAPRRAMAPAEWEMGFGQRVPPAAADSGVEAVLGGVDGGSVAPYSGPDGVAVMGQWRWIDALSIGVVTEWRTSEALAPARRFTRVVWAGMAAFELLLFGTLLAFVRRSREQSRDRAEVQAVLDAAPVPICVRDVDGRPLLENQTSAALRRSANARLPDLRGLEEGRPISEDVEVDLGGEVRIMRAVRTRLPGTVRGVTAVCSVAVDITEQRHANAALQALTEDLEQRVLERTEAARAANAAKDEFLARMSHELRTPLNGVLGLIELTLQEPLGDVASEYIHRAHSTAGILRDLINEVLDFAKIENSDITLVSEDFATEDLLAPLPAIVMGADPDGRVELVLRLDADVPDRLRGDLARLRQVLVNLVGNAAKFTAEGRILVHLSCHPGHDGRARIDVEVSDTGVGFAPELAEALFVPFQQADDTVHREFGGTGLGLAITHRIITAMGGDISAEGRPGQGATFRFSVWLGVLDEGRPRRPLAGQRVGLLAEDGVHRGTMTELLEARGAEVVVVDRVAPQLPVVVADARAADRLKTLSADQLDRVVLVARVGDRPALAASGLLDKVRAVVSHPPTRSSLSAALESIHWTVEIVPVPAAVAPLPARVLLVEDSTVLQMVLQRQLELVGVQTEVAADGRAAVRLGTAQTWDLVLLDMQLPYLDGPDIARALRAHHGPGLKMVAMSGHFSEAIVRELSAQGVEDHMLKPVSQADLARVVARYLGPASSRLSA